ncbi:lipopolysaccharide biosynthesis protein [Burkholderia ambifaria]|uniref:lipopolysaccharide biosynthesis protein n=1 Tax=Burkholderia ambifaria TaxID=152480 RepID=UPI001FC87AEA|nr:oligosaccharide flippase family protein [Burkholderia ambifaria]
MTFRAPSRIGAVRSAGTAATGSQLRESAISLAGTVVAQAAFFVYIMHVARDYGPDVLGAFNFQLATGTLAGTLLALRYDLACLSHEPRRAFAALVNVAAFAACIAGCWLATSYVAGHPASALLIAFALAVNVQLAANGYLGSLRRYAWIAAAKIAVNALAVVALLAPPSAGFDARPDPFHVYALTGALVAFATLVGIFRHGRRRGYSFRIDTAFFGEHRRFPVYILPATLCAAVLTYALSIAVPLWFSAEEAGQFAAAWRLGFFPVSLIGAALGQVFRRDALAAIARADASRALRAAYASHARVLFAIALLYAVGSAMLFRPLVVLCIGASWLPATDLQFRLIPLFALQMVYVPLSQIFLAVRAQRADFLFQLSCGTVSICTLLVAHRHALSLASSVSLFALSGAAMMALGIALTHRYATLPDGGRT